MLAYWQDNPNEKASSIAIKMAPIVFKRAFDRWREPLEQALRARGIKKGDVVGVYLTNVSETGLIFLAAANIGAVFCSAGMEMGGDDL